MLEPSQMVKRELNDAPLTKSRKKTKQKNRVSSKTLQQQKNMEPTVLNPKMLTYASLEGIEKQQQIKRQKVEESQGILYV
jgi:hypothetical protein